MRQRKTQRDTEASSHDRRAFLGRAGAVAATVAEGLVTFVTFVTNSSFNAVFGCGRLGRAVLICGWK